MAALAPIAAFASRSVTGARRLVNEDRFLVDGELGFALLADGVAGRPAGESAAEIAIEAASLQLCRALESGRCPDVATARRILEDAVRFANSTVRRLGARDESLANMASTFVGAVFTAGHAVIASLGDSRGYRLRRGSLTQLTRDHVASREGLSDLSEREAAALRPFRILTRALGDGDSVEPEIWVEPLVPDDLFLMCSNGLSDTLERSRMAEILARAKCLDEACDVLAEAAVEVGADDDLTVVLVKPRTGGGAGSHEART